MRFFLIVILAWLQWSCKEKASPQNKMENAIVEETASSCIERILAKDDSLGKLRNDLTEDLSLTESINDYTDNLKTLNYSNCPPAFTSAFNDHINSWLEIRAVTDNYSSLRGEMHTLFETIEAGKDSLRFKSLTGEIWSTWEEVEKISRKY